VLVGRQRLVELVLGARTWDLRRDGEGLTLLVDDVPVVFEDGSDGSWLPVLLPSRLPDAEAGNSPDARIPS
jgi:hypothetical protein